MKKLLLFGILVFLLSNMYAQKRYSHFQRVKIKRNHIVDKPVSTEDLQTFVDSPAVDRREEVVQLETLNFSETVPAQLVPIMERSVQLNGSPIIVKEQKKSYTRMCKNKIKLSPHQHPLKTSMDSDELYMMAWISLGAFVTFLVAFIINFLLAGFSTVAIIMIVLTGVFALATIVFFILAKVFE